MYSIGLTNNVSIVFPNAVSAITEAKEDGKECFVA
jgi:hypothetical protein